MRSVPALLIALRGLLGAVLLILGLGGQTGWPFAVLLTAGLLSDIFDGVLARRMGVASAPLRLAGRVVNGVFVSCVEVGLLTVHWEAVQAHWPVLTV